jgi:putative endonuclease
MFRDRDSFGSLNGQWFFLGTIHSRANAVSASGFIIVIPGRRVAASPESITTDVSYMSYYVYLLASRKYGTLYLGVTNDLVRRVYEHKSRTTAGFTSKYGVDRLVWFETYDDPQTAIEREKEIKKWRRNWKIRLIEEENLDWRDLYATITK